MKAVARQRLFRHDDDDEIITDIQFMTILYNLYGVPTVIHEYQVLQFFGDLKLQPDGSDGVKLRLNSIQNIGIPGSTPGIARILSKYCPSVLTTDTTSTVIRPQLPHPRLRVVT
jgi:hypothetical protein